MMQEIETIRSEAAKGLERAEREKVDLLAGVKSKDEEIKYFAKILKDVPQSPSGRSGKSGSHNTKNSAGKVELIEAALGVLTENRPQAIPLDDLKSLVQERLKKEGFGLVGSFRYFPRYIEECESIAKTENGFYGLAGDDVSQVA